MARSFLAGGQLLAMTADYPTEAADITNKTCWGGIGFARIVPSALLCPTGVNILMAFLVGIFVLWSSSLPSFIFQSSSRVLPRRGVLKSLASDVVPCVLSSERLLQEECETFQSQPNVKSGQWIAKT